MNETTAEHPSTLPDTLAPFPERVSAARKHLKALQTDLASNEQKLRDADAERAELQNGDPTNEETVRKLTEAHARLELFRNRQAKLEKEVAEALAAVGGISAHFIREVLKIALEARLFFRRQFLAKVATLVGDSEQNIAASLGPSLGRNELQSCEERLAQSLEHLARDAASDRHGAAPGRAFDDMMEGYRSFQQELKGYEQAQEA